MNASRTYTLLTLLLVFIISTASKCKKELVVDCSALTLEFKQEKMEAAQREKIQQRLSRIDPQGKNLQLWSLYYTCSDENLNPVKIRIANAKLLGTDSALVSFPHENAFGFHLKESEKPVRFGSAYIYNVQKDVSLTVEANTGKGRYEAIDCISNISILPKEIAEDTSHPLVVSFYSIGGGIDYKTFKSYKSFLEQEYGGFINEIVSWGMEGEQDICISLEALNEVEQKQLLDETKRRLADKQVHIYTDKACRKSRP